MLKRFFNRNSKPKVYIQPAVVEKDKELSFEDINLETYLRNITGKKTGKLFLSDVYNVKELDFNGWPLLSVRGIENVVNLEELILYGSKMNNITFLGKLKKLKKLDISWSDSISEIQSLTSLEELEDLSLVFSPKVSNFALVTEMPRLKRLNLSEDSLFNVRFLESMNNLEELILSKNRIKDISPIMELENLKKLDISANEIHELGELCNSQLEYLDISANKIKDISFLKNQNNLKYFDARGNEIDKKIALNKKLISELKKNGCKVKI